MVAAPAAGLVEMAVLICLGVVLICLACVSTRLPWALDKVTASVEKEFGPSAVYGKSNRAANLPCKHFLAIVYSVVEEGSFREEPPMNTRDQFKIAQIVGMLLIFQRVRFAFLRVLCGVVMLFANRRFIQKWLLTHTETCISRG